VIQAITLLREISMLLMFGAVVWMTPSVVTVVFGKPRHSDPLYTLLWFICIVWMLFSATWIILPGAMRVMSPQELQVRFALQTLSLLCVCGVYGVRFSYGRD
jgi:hypothetical protein